MNGGTVEHFNFSVHNFMFPKFQCMSFPKRKAKLPLNIKINLEN